MPISLLEFKPSTYLDLIKSSGEKGFNRGFDSGHGSGLSSGRAQGVAGSAAVVGVAALIAIAYYVYKNYLSKAAQACTKFKGLEKKKCMYKFKIAGAQAAIKKLQQSMKLCKNKKNPAKCEYQLKVQMKKWQERIQKWNSKLG